MKVLVFVWTFKDVSFLVIMGGLLLWCGYLWAKATIEYYTEKWKEKKNKKKEEEQ